MNFSSVFKKVTITFFYLSCYIATLNSVEADRSVRLIKTKLSNPVHIHLPSAAAGPTYARRYGYGRPVMNYSTQGNYWKNKRYFGRRQGKLGRNYANGYRNWLPNRIYGGKNNPRVDNAKRGQGKFRKDPYGPSRDLGYGSKQKRRVRPHGSNPLQRPQPPKYVSDFEDDYFFPEEAMRAETKYDADGAYQRSKKKGRRNPTDLDKTFRRPHPKRPFHDTSVNHHRTKTRGAPMPYGAFQHPLNDEDDYDVDVENPQPMAKSKRKKLKKKSNSRKKNKGEEHSSYSNEKDEDRFEAVYINDFEPPAKSPQKPMKKPFHEGRDEDDSYSDKNHHSNSRVKGGLSSYEDNYDEYKKGQNQHDAIQYSPYPPTWSQVTESTNHPASYQAGTGYQPQDHVQNQYQNQHQNQYPYQNADNSHTQKPVPVNYQQQSTVYSQPDNGQKILGFSTNYVNSQASSAGTQASNGYNFNGYSNPAFSSYRQPVNSYGDHLRQKINPSFDTADPYYGYSSNGYAKNESPVYSESQQYSNRLATVYQNNVYKRDEIDFLKRHQNLYHKGLSGIPIQGDGYGKENLKKDYDIGYGDFQFDENVGS